MSAYCAVPGCSSCGLVHVQKAEVRDGRRYVDGVDQGEAQPNAAIPKRLHGGERTGGRPRKRR